MRPTKKPPAFVATTPTLRLPVTGPMDFSAWFEAYLDGRWHTFDPRNNVSRIGRVLIAPGRDAADVAISSTFGPKILKSFHVHTAVHEPLSS